VEAIGTAIWDLIIRPPHRNTLENPMTSKPFFLDGLSSGFRLPNQFCYTHIHYFNSFGNFRVCSIQYYHAYAYPSFWAWVTGSLLWARFSSGCQNTAPYPREVKDKDCWQCNKRGHIQKMCKSKHSDKVPKKTKMCISLLKLIQNYWWRILLFLKETDRKIIWVTPEVEGWH
jgi:hypothetical protein